MTHDHGTAMTHLERITLAAHDEKMRATSPRDPYFAKRKAPAARGELDPREHSAWEASQQRIARERRAKVARDMLASGCDAGAIEERTGRRPSTDWLSE